jgi:hypothetical protein
MKVVYYSSAMTGSGHVVKGISIANAFRRGAFAVDYTLLSCNPTFAPLAERLGVRHVEIPLEDERQLAAAAAEHSVLFETLASLSPDVLLVDLAWYMCQHVVGKLPGKKILLCRQVEDRFFRIPLASGLLEFRADLYDRVIATEPFRSSVPMETIDPLIIRNRDEILDRHAALERLGAAPDTPVCLFAVNGKPGELERVRRTYSYLEGEGYTVIYSSNFAGGLFPAVDYFNGVDLLITSAGYNSFWEAVFFEKEAIFVPQPRRFEDQRRRVAECQEMRLVHNGADQLVRLVVDL